MIDVVIPLGKGSKHADLELKYSLRSLEKNLQGVRNVFIVGERPDWLNGSAIHIPCPDAHQNAARNIVTKVALACQDERLSGEFVLANDDYFYCQPFDISTYPHYWKCTLEESLKRNRKAGTYYRHVDETLKALKTKGLPTFNFDTHFPMRMEKKKLLEVAAAHNWQGQFGLILKSTYCNTLGIEGVHRDPDCKAYNRRPVKWWEQYASEREVFSIDNQCLRDEGLKQWLANTFPEKSRFER